MATAFPSTRSLNKPTFQRGAWTAVLGPNGAGKSTLLRSMLNGNGKDIAYLPQTGTVDLSHNELTAAQVVMLGRLPHQSWLASPNTKDNEIVRKSLEDMGALALSDRPLAQLSGGERQRVLLARVLAGQTDTLLLDEPLLNLDPPQQFDCLRLFQRLAKQGRTVVTVLHEINYALMADRIMLMQGGEVVFEGASSESHAAINQVFGGRLTFHQVADQWVVLGL